MRHKLSFALTPTQVVQRYWAGHHRDICAGQVLALRACMETLDRNISELATHSQVPRAIVSEMISMKAVGTTDTRASLAESVGFELLAFDLLARF